jgi:hypothetical protein
MMERCVLLFFILSQPNDQYVSLQDIMKLIERFLTIARQRHSDVTIDLGGWQTRVLNVGSMAHTSQHYLLT